MLRSYAAALEAGVQLVEEVLLVNDIRETEYGPGDKEEVWKKVPTPEDMRKFEPQLGWPRDEVRGRRRGRFNTSGC